MSKDWKIKAIMNIVNGGPLPITGFKIETEDGKYLVSREGIPEIISEKEYSKLHIKEGHIVVPGNAKGGERAN